MTGCQEWRDALAACALGDIASPAFAAHLAVCPECATALAESRTAAARINEALERRAAVRPPTGGPERVMARIGRRNRVDLRLWWKWAAVVSVAVILVTIVVWTRRPATHLVNLQAWRSPTQALLRPPVAAAWSTTPRLGEAFFKINSGEAHAQ